MTIYDWILFFIIAICSIITGISVFKWWDWKHESNENLDLYLKEKNALDVVKAELDKKNEELKTFKDMERVVKFESVVSQPIELECKFQVQEELIAHTDLFKRLCVSEAARYLAEEIERQPTLYRLIFEKNPMICCENVRIRFRLLPYPEGAVWDIKEEEK